MKIAIRKEPNGSIYIDKNLRDDIPYTEPPYNFIIIEVEKEDCQSSDFNDDLTFNIEKYNARKQKEIDKIEMSNISNWFNADYTKNEQKFRRLYTLKLKCDDGADPLEKLTELYKEAEEKRKLYQQYEKEITENGTLHDNII